jgi:hypothetical protein
MGVDVSDAVKLLGGDGVDDGVQRATVSTVV